MVGEGEALQVDDCEGLNRESRGGEVRGKGLDMEMKVRIL